MTRPAARPRGLAIGALGAASAVAALSIGGWGAGEWGSRTVPLLASLLLALCGLADALSRPPGSSSAGGRDGPLAGATPGEGTGEWRVLALLALTVLYVLAIDRIGYLAATALASPAAFVLFDVRRPLALLLAALIVPLALHVAFFRLLGVFPPFGRWFDVLDVVPL